MPFRTNTDNFRLPETDELALFADLHGNADAFDAAVEQLDERDPDATSPVVILGDLFTYGCQPGRILDRVVALADDRDVWLIVGNHDEFYFESLGHTDAATRDRPDWIRETIDWTRRRLEGRLDALDDRNIWHRDLQSDALYLSHANPFPGRDWTYLRDDTTRRRALKRLDESSRRIGIFGHTHRRWAFRSTGDGPPEEIDDDRLLRNEIPLDAGSWILNPGSVGQPREESPTSSFLLLRRDDETLVANYRRISYDPRVQVDAIRQTELSDETTRRLVDYLLPSTD